MKKGRGRYDVDQGLASEMGDVWIIVGDSVSALSLVRLRIK